MRATSTPSAGVNARAFDALRRELVDLVEPLSDEQLLDLADGIHELLRQRRTVRNHHRQRMCDRTAGRFDLSI